MKTHDEIVALAAQLGFTVAGVLGSGHVKLVHRNGGTVTIPSTPSEYRGRANMIAQMERVAGEKLPRAKHRRSRKAVKPSGFSLEAARREQATWHQLHDHTVEQLHAERDALIDRCQQLAERRHSLTDIPPLLERIDALEGQLRAHHQAVEPFDPYTLRSS